MAISLTQIAYQGWPHCYRLSDGAVEAIVTSDVGPRVIRCGFTDGPNLFAEFAEELGQIGGDAWRSYGGHRLWSSSETRARCYHPDNFPVAAELSRDGLRLRQPVEPNTGMEKELEVSLDSQTHRFKVVHRLTNRGNWPVALAAWALSVMRPGGVGIVRNTGPRTRRACFPIVILRFGHTRI
jgi:hypothetical protein